MSNMRSNCFSFALVTSRQPVFQNCKEILYAPSSGFSSCLEWWYIETLTLLVILHVALFNCLSIIIADQNNSFHGQVGSVIGQISIQRELSLCYSMLSQDTSFRECVLFGDCLRSYTLTRCLCSFCSEKDKVSSQAHRPQLVVLTAIIPATVQLGLFDLLGFLAGTWGYLACQQHINLIKLLMCSYIYFSNFQLQGLGFVNFQFVVVQ